MGQQPGINQWSQDGDRARRVATGVGDKPSPTDGLAIHFRQPVDGAIQQFLIEQELRGTADRGDDLALADAPVVDRDGEGLEERRGEARAEGQRAGGLGLQVGVALAEDDRDRVRVAVEARDLGTVDVVVGGTRALEGRDVGLDQVRGAERGGAGEL